MRPDAMRPDAAVRLTRGADGYQQLGQPERWSNSLIRLFSLASGRSLLSIALERVTVERFMLARVVAAAAVPR